MPSGVTAHVLKTLRGCTVEMISAPPPTKAARSQGTMEADIEDGEIMKNINRTTTRREMFVLPSQLNGAEYPSPHSIVKNVMQYTTDQTGGPRGQLACDLVVAQFICDNASNQLNPSGIDYVREITASTPTISLRNGYLTEQAGSGASRTDCKEFVDKIMHMKILLSRNIAVSGLLPAHPLNHKSIRHKGGLAKSKRVDLVYASAVPYGTYGNGSSAQWATVCRAVLKQQYYLALAAAVRCIRRHRHKSYKIYFMPLGGGVFGNPFAWAFEALRQAIVDAQSTFLTNNMSCIITISILTWEGRPEEFVSFAKLHRVGKTQAKGPPLKNAKSSKAPKKSKTMYKESQGAASNGLVQKTVKRP